MTEPNLPAVTPEGPQDTVWWKLVNLQPAAWRGIIVAVVAVLAAFGIKVSPDLPDVLMIVLLALLPIIQAIWTKSAVTPNAKVAVRVPDPVNAPGEVEAGEAVVPDDTPASEVLDAAASQGE